MNFKPLDVIKVNVGRTTFYYVLTHVDGVKLQTVSPMTGEVEWFHAEDERVKFHRRSK